MPLSRAMPRIWVGIGALAVFAFATASAWSQSSTARVPREIRFGSADMIIQRVEPEVSREEIRAAVQAQLDRETMCFPWPGVWLDATERRRVFVVRYDLMRRDWGVETADDAHTRMQEFVDMGLLTMRARPEIGSGVSEYHLTGHGYAHLRSSAGGSRMSFCMPAERRVVEVTDAQFGDFACGTTQVRFTHMADTWPSWARTQTSQARVTDTWGPIGGIGEGTVSMSRQWFNENPRDGRENGQLRSLCYDNEARAVRGEDLELSPASAP